MIRFKKKFQEEGRGKKEGYKKYKSTRITVTKQIDKEKPEVIALGLPSVTFFQLFPL